MRLVRTAAATAVGIALLTSCSNGQTANETLPSASSSATEASESLPPLGPADFPMPIEAREKTQAGAIAASQYFIQLTVRAYQQGDTEPVRTLSRDCEYCEALIDAVNEDQAAGNRITGGDVSFADPGQAYLTGETAETAFTVEQTSLSVIGPDDEAIASRAQPSFTAFTALAATWSPDLQAWLVNQLTIT
ncbi:DUF6318 family protein [Modestobacter italicus]|uniref:DUF6318 family protein n=1 Tax=Modestobacter italicus (strain DSM 44449 / CECT 9708 / BC 501) TaxID=2732864 RepID=UPI001C980B6A|nr:DUF6318 family protein [Modestobacter italicus]